MLNFILPGENQGLSAAPELRTVFLGYRKGNYGQLWDAALCFCDGRILDL